MADLRAFGAPDEIIAAVESESVELEIEPDNWETVNVFMRVQTQWRQGFGGPTGLDYPAVFQTMDRIGVRDADGEIFAGLQIMERAALNCQAQGA